MAKRSRKELKAEINILQARVGVLNGLRAATIARLQDQIADLQAQIADLKAQLAACEAKLPTDPPPPVDPPPGPAPKILAEDLAIDPDPTLLWKQITAASPAHVIRENVTPDPHTAVGQRGPSALYRILRLADAKLTKATAFTAEPFECAVDDAFDWPLKGTFATPRPTDVQVAYSGISDDDRTLLGCRLVSGKPATYPAGTRLACQDTYAQGQKGNETYRTQLVNNSETSTFHRYDPGSVSVTYLSCRFQPDSPLIAGAKEGSQVWQIKQTKASGAPIISAVEYRDKLILRRNLNKKLTELATVGIDRSGKWMRFAIELVADPDPKKGSIGLWVRFDNGPWQQALAPTSMQTLYDQSDQGKYATLSIGPYQDAEVPAVWRAYANVQVVEGRFE